MNLHVIIFLKIPYLGLTHVCVKRYDVSMREHSWAHYHNCAIDRIVGPKIRKSLKIGIWKPEYFHLKPLMHRMNVTKDLCPYLVWITSYGLLRTIQVQNNYSWNTRTNCGANLELLRYLREQQ